MHHCHKTTAPLQRALLLGVQHSTHLHKGDPQRLRNGLDHKVDKSLQRKAVRARLYEHRRAGTSPDHAQRHYEV